MSTTTPAEILDAALKLPVNDRERIARELFNSVPPSGVMSEDDPGFLAELDRRVAEYEKDPSTSVSWEEVREELQQQLRSERTA